MNLTTITNIPTGNWKRVTTHSVSAAAGVALAISALVGLSVKSSSGGNESTPSVGPAVVQRPAEQAPLRVVVVSNIEHQEKLQSQFAADEYAAGYTLQNRPIVAVKGSAIEQALVGASSEIAGSGREVQLTDLTLPAKILIPGAALNAASDADITASVLSTELANYLAPVASVNASDADVLASALSGEMATYDFGAIQPMQRQVSAADIDAAILSSEMATYAWMVAAPRQVSQADIAASVLSTELATYAP